MGRQIEFYFDDGDEREFIKLAQFKDVVFLKFREMEFRKYEECLDIKKKAYSEASWNQTCICIERDLKSVKLLGKDGNFFVDLHVSPVIEFSRSGYKPELNRLISGRLWYQHKYWAKDENGHDVLMEKSKELEKLYNSLVRWIKKYCKRLPNGNYIGPHAMVLYKNGTELSP